MNNVQRSAFKLLQVATLATPSLVMSQHVGFTEDLKEKQLLHH